MPWHKGSISICLIFNTNIFKFTKTNGKYKANKTAIFKLVLRDIWCEFQVLKSEDRLLFKERSVER